MKDNPSFARTRKGRLRQLALTCAVGCRSRMVASASLAVPICIAMAFCTVVPPYASADRLGCSYCKSACGSECVPCLKEAAVEVVEWGVVSESVCHACFKPIRLSDCCSLCQAESCTCPGTDSSWNPFRSRPRKRLMRKTLSYSVDTIGHYPASGCRYGCSGRDGQGCTHSEAPNRFVVAPQMRPPATGIAERTPAQVVKAPSALTVRGMIPRDRTIDSSLIDSRLADRTPSESNPALSDRSDFWRQLTGAAGSFGKKAEQTPQLAPIVSATRYDLGHSVDAKLPVRVAASPEIRLTSATEPIDSRSDPPTPKPVEISIDSDENQIQDETAVETVGR